MYVVVLKSKLTNEIFGVQKTVCDEPCRFQDYSAAQRSAIEKNYHVKKDEFIWVAKEDDGIYFKLDKESIDE